MYDAVLRVVFVLAYFFPYPFFALFGYFERDKIRYFLLLAAAMVFLAVVTWATKHRLIACGGIILNGITSAFTTSGYMEEWSARTAPMHVMALLIVIMLVIAALHMAIWIYLDKKCGER